MSILRIFSLLVLCPYFCIAQHQDVFPDLSGGDLLDAVQVAFTPEDVLTYSTARDTLFKSVYAVDDSLECVYSGWKRYLDPSLDPTQAVFTNNGDDLDINTEHCYPQSKGAEVGNGRADMHHLFPTRATVNSNRANDPFMDIVETPEKETAKDLFLLSFIEAAKELTEWKANNGDYNWQAYKATRVGHLLQALPAFSRFDLPIGGDRNIVNATSSTHGPSWRMIVEMSSPPKALGIYPGGQSGNPGSIYYDNFIDDWAIGKYHKLNFMQNATATDQIMATQILTPSN